MRFTETECKFCCGPTLGRQWSTPCGRMEDFPRQRANSACRCSSRSIQRHVSMETIVHLPKISAFLLQNIDTDIYTQYTVKCVCVYTIMWKHVCTQTLPSRSKLSIAPFEKTTHKDIRNHYTTSHRKCMAISRVNTQSQQNDTKYVFGRLMLCCGIMSLSWTP